MRTQSESVSGTAGLQFSTAFPVARHVEYLTPCADCDERLAEPLSLNEDGTLTIPNSPGLGIEIDADRLRAFSPDTATFR